MYHKNHYISNQPAIGKILHQKKNHGRRSWDQNQTKLKSPTLFSYRHHATQLPQPSGDSPGSNSNSCDSSTMPSSVTNELGIWVGAAAIKPSASGILSELEPDLLVPSSPLSCADLTDRCEDNITEDDFNQYIPFTDYVINGDWDNANESLRELDDPCGSVTVADPRDEYGDTALHVTARQGHVHILKELLSLLKVRQEEVLELKTSQDFTTFGSGINLGISEEVLMERAKYMVEQYEKMVSNILNVQNAEGSTVLHLAVLAGDVDIVKELMSLMRSEAMEEKDAVGDTALIAAITHCKDEEVIEIAKSMAQKNNKVFVIPSPHYDNDIPVVVALRKSKWESARYLYSVTPLEVLDGIDGSRLICLCLDIDKPIDLAWDLLRRIPILAFIINEASKTSPMLTLARIRYVFVSGTRLTSWQRWIYNRIHIREVAPVNIHDIFINVDGLEEDLDIQMDFISSVMSLFRRLVKGLQKLCGIHGLYEMKATHTWIFQFLRCIGEVTRNDNLTADQHVMVKKSIFKAIEQGHFEFVTHICKANPKLLDLEDEKGRSIIHFSIENRQEKVYSLIYELDEERRINIGNCLVNMDNNLLHYAANLSSLPQFDHIQDASLQMQRELQWFKEVERVVPPKMHEHRNRSNDMTARELFTKNHKKLMEDAKKSIKGTATSCTVVGALIVTIMFAVAFTVPGGNNGNTGLPLFLDQKLFKVFIISDTISLASSTTSVITFLGILTSRYAEDDFLKSLPTKILIGLVTLFFAITTMMIAFSCALAIMLDGDAWIVSLSVLFASVPVISFVWFLFPLLVQILMSTYGHGIFDRKVKP